MINNLFSIFDPSSSLFSSAWILLIIMVIPFSINIWITKTPNSNVNDTIINFLFNEISFTLGNSINSQQIFCLTIFLTILFINVSALYPQVFSLSSHLSITLPLSLSTWSTVMLFGWINNPNHMLAHLVPQGTPDVLVSFIVLIELTSNLIRPITLCVRLTANIIAGHLLITLLGNALVNLSNTLVILSVPLPLVLTVLESAVAFIQSYVFITLISLYTTETN